MSSQLTNNPADIILNEDYTEIIIEGASTVSRECPLEKPRIYFTGEFIGGNTLEVYIRPKLDAMYAYRPSVNIGILDDTVYPWLWTLPDVMYNTQATFTVTMIVRNPSHTNTKCTISASAIATMSYNPVVTTCSINATAVGQVEWNNALTVNCDITTNVSGTVNRNPAEVDCSINAIGSGVIIRGGRSTGINCSITTDVIGSRIITGETNINCSVSLSGEGIRFINPAAVDCIINTSVIGKINLSGIADTNCTVNINAVAEVV